ncbi:MBL fold metallo-hydrolase [Nocardioides luteus]|uniref:MBL fold metallo-hydrolase n=1 Tax=Nocardioides luteus TaxID=1844 RepID=A0A1J4N3U5_9ACTN|nr:rhodanese-like domain-containing protein [Nocardioides luteus]OIJ26237.1 MBL fold metallo-hydrolase [Nocardioides luteus]
MIHDLVTAVPDRGLGNNAYLVDLGEGAALAVDASRDLRALRAEADRRGLRVTHAADTHLHADFLSGAVQLAADEGAQVLASKAGGRTFEHTALEDEQEIALNGGLVLRALATPGHTDEHLSFALLDGDRALGVFSGGSLIVGSAARVDLVDPARTESLARAQFRSVRRIAALGDDTALWPTHGGGSFCSTAATATSTSTIGKERATNALLDLDEEGFVRALLDSHGTYPTYFRRLGERNRRGPAVVGARPVLEAIPAQVAAEGQRHGVVLVDVRPIAAFAAAHPRDALSIPLRGAFASWLGWVAPHDRPIIVLRDEDQDPDEILWQALKIGYENLTGEISGGLAAWEEAGLPIASLPMTDVATAGEKRVIDVRQGREYEAGHVPGALHLELGSLENAAPGLADVPTLVMCGHGERAMSAASILQRHGFTRLTVLNGGPESVVLEAAE